MGRKFILVLLENKLLSKLYSQKFSVSRVVSINTWELAKGLGYLVRD